MELGIQITALLFSLCMIKVFLIETIVIDKYGKKNNFILLPKGRGEGIMVLDFLLL